jgi:hypothetical protein
MTLTLAHISSSNIFILHLSFAPPPPQLRQGSSFWNQKLIWRTFFGAMVCAFTINIFKQLTRNVGVWDEIGSSGNLGEEGGGVVTWQGCSVFEVQFLFLLFKFI